jgi:thioredoxin 1
MRTAIPVLIIGIVLVLQGCNSKSENTNQKADPLKTGKSVSKIETGTTEPAISSPVHITKADFLDKIMDYEKNTTDWVYKGDLPCLIDFYADWCRPCRMTAPIMDELAKEYAGRIIIYKVNVDQERELASVFGIQSIPAFLMCPIQGKPSMSSGIANTPEQTKKMFVEQIESILLKGNDPSGTL